MKSRLVLTREISCGDSAQDYADVTNQMPGVSKERQ